MSASASNFASKVHVCLLLTESITSSHPLSLPQIKNASERGWAGFTSWVQGTEKENGDEDNKEAADDREDEEDGEYEERYVKDQPIQEPFPAKLPLSKATKGGYGSLGGGYGSLGGDANKAADKAPEQKPQQKWADDDWGDWGWGDSNVETSKSK